MIYFDNSATTRVLPQAGETALRSMTEEYYNPSGAYGAAYTIEKQVTEAREYAARTLGVTAEEVYFTSGGTESNNISIFGTLQPLRHKVRILTTMVEHPSVYETVQAAAKQYNAEVSYVPLHPDGTIDLDQFSDMLDDSVSLVSIMHVNNELGSINSLPQIADLIQKKAPQAVFHSDGVQAFLKTDSAPVTCDLYSVSAHKFHAPKGIGLLYVKKGVKNTGGQIGGGQEKNFRSGTLNVPAILGMETAMRAYVEHMTEWHASMFAVKKRLYENLSSIPDVMLNGPSIEEGAKHILNVSFLGVRGEVLLHAVEQKGLIISTGSACSSKKIGKNRILSSVGITGSRQEGAIRFSFCPFNTLDEADAAAGIIEEQVRFLRRYKRR